MTQRILVPVDVSDQSKKALRWALNEQPDAEITVLHVVDPRLPGHMPGVDLDDVDAGSDDYRLQAAEKYLENVLRELGAGDLETEVEEGLSASREIVEYAEEGDFDHLVIGSHGRSGVTRVLLGSVAENVVRRSPTPVTVVR